MSVALATFNGARYLPAQLASIESQTTPPAELVVYDDGSSDGSPALVSEFAARAPFPVRAIGEPERAGSSVAFERAISACENDVIVLCDQDDLWTPDKLSRLGEAFEHDASAVMAFSDGDLIDEDGHPLRRSLWQ
jgi:glycosyltransferase involved in cell wall biosynthesis